jgi:acetyltransferase-like isoleucine patch superfamily enzyme
MSIVIKGVTVGEHSLIGANSYVRQDIPPYSIAVGSPARIVGRVELVNDTDVHLIYEEK